MPRVLFVNPQEPRCGVFQYGTRLFDILARSRFFQCHYYEPKDEADLRRFATLVNPEICIYNWIDGIGGFLVNAPFGFCRHNVTVFHDGWIDPARWGAILFSDPTMQARAQWHPIGRPLPIYQAENEQPEHNPRWIGINGFLGAWAILGARKVLEEYKEAKIRLHLPAARYGDDTGHRARETDHAIRMMAVNHPGIEVETEFEFMGAYPLLHWLAENDLNLYMRDLPDGWRGVSSVLDLALAVHRPIAVNRCVAFRHVHGVSPSICVEYNSLETIIRNGIAPLKNLYRIWDLDVVCKDVERVLAKLIGIAL